jgi:hypothetical protein
MTTMAPSIEIPAGAEPIGAFRDAEPRALPYRMPLWGYSVTGCFELCSTMAKKIRSGPTTFRLFALQGSQCFCGDDEARATQYGRATCGMMGDEWCNYIYR